MVDPAIETFFEERKAAWLKKNLKATMSEVEVREKEIECETVFCLQQWLPSAAKRAGSRAFTSHPSKFGHPSTGIGKANRKNFTYVTPLICKPKFIPDGFLKSGSVNVELDSLGDAAALDVDKFLSLKMQDGQNVIQHLNFDTELAKNLFTLANVEDNENYQSLKKGFLAMTANDAEVVTSSKIKQVYFPVIPQQTDNQLGCDNYHQLSILTASGILFELRKRLDAMRFGDEIKLARAQKKTNQEHQGYREIYNLTTIGYGGTKPQNISVLNNQNGGKAHMFMCIPPQLKNRDIHFPTADFFNQTVNYFQCKNQFNQLHKLYSRDDNNIHIRTARDEYYQSIIDHIIEKMWQVRSVSAEQFSVSSNQLSAAQKTWLCEQHEAKEKRENTDDWLDEIVKSFTTFLVHGYEKVLNKKAIKLGDAEYKHMQKQVTLSKEALR